MSDRRAEHGETRMTLRQDGYWHAYVSMGLDPVSGKRIRPHLSAKTKKKLRDKVTQAKRDLGAGNIESAGNTSVEEWLRHWLSVVAGSERANTYHRKEWAVRNWLIPSLAGVSLKGLTPEKIERALRRPINYKGELGTDNTRSEILRVLKTALELAVERQWISRNPAHTVKFSVPEAKEITAMERDEVAKFFTAARQRPNFARWLVGFALGLRQGEVLGLQWDDFDFENGTVRVRRQWIRQSYTHGCTEETACPSRAAKCPLRVPTERIQPLKTTAAKRTLALAAPVLAEMKKHRVLQMQQQLAAGYWEPGDWVFTNNIGRPLEHRRDLSDFKRVCRDAGIPERRVHDMRHQLATAFLVGGITERQLQDWFGWTTSRMAGRYQHVVDEAKRAAADVGALQILGANFSGSN